MLDVNYLKVHIQQVTGHKNVEYLNHYIDLVKSEITGIDNVVKKVNESSHLVLIEKEKSKLLDDLEKGIISTEEYIYKIKQIKFLNFFKFYFRFFLKRYHILQF